MAFGVLAHTIKADAGGSGTSPMTTPAIDTSAAVGPVTIVVSVFAQNATTIGSISDNKGNTYTAIGTVQTYVFGGAGAWAFKCVGATVGAGHTFSLTKPGGYETNEATICVAVIDEAGDLSAATTYDATGDYSGTITPTVAGSLLLSGWGSADYSGQNNTYSISGSTPNWTLLDFDGNASIAHNNAAHAWETSTSTSAHGITYASTPGSISAGSAMYMFEVLAGGPPPQEAYPNVDVTDGAWTPSAGADLYAVLDDASDADCITTNSNTTGKVGLAALSTPVAGTQTLAFRASGSPAKKLIATLIEGAGTSRGTVTVDPLTGTATDYSFSPSGISNYGDLDIQYEIANATTPPTPSVSFGAIGTGVNGGTSISVPVPTGIVAGDYLLIHVTSGATNSETPGTPSGWTLLATGASTDGTFGIDTGPRRATVFGKPAVGGETAVTVATTNGNTVRGTMSRWVLGHAGYAWDVVAQGANDSTSGTGVSMTTAAISWAVGDCAVAVTGQRVDSATQSAQALTAAGITFGARTNRAATAVTTGNDHRHSVDTFAANTAGTASVATTWAYTASAAASAGGVIVRLREVPPTEFGRVYTTKLTIPAAAGGGGLTVSASITMAGATVAATATALVKADASITLAGATVAATATAPVKADASITMAGATVAATISQGSPATLDASITMAGASVAATATAPARASASITMAGATVAATATAPARASASITMAGATVAATATAPARASASITMAGATVAATATAPVKADASITMAGATVVANISTGNTRNLAADITMAGASVAATATAPVKADASITMAGATVAATATAPARASASITMAGATVAATATAPARASASITMAGCSVSASAAVVARTDASIVLSGCSVAATMSAFDPRALDASITLAGATVAATMSVHAAITWGEFAVAAERLVEFATIAAQKTDFQANIAKSTPFRVDAR